MDGVSLLCGITLHHSCGYLRMSTEVGKENDGDARSTANSLSQAIAWTKSSSECPVHVRESRTFEYRANSRAQSSGVYV